MPKPKILGIDIETAPMTAHVWGLWKQNVGLSQLMDSSRTMCFAAKWFGQKGIEFTREVGPDKNENVVDRAWELLNEADIVVHFNGKKFDIPTLNKEFLLHGYVPPSPYKQVDLLQVTKQQFRFPSNKLDYVAKALGLKGKVKHIGHELWVKCMTGDESAWKEMERYNCLTPDHKVLHKDLTWRTLANTKVGDKILGFDEDGPNRMYREAVVDSLEFKPAEVFEVALESGKTFKVTANHKWLTARTRTTNGRTGQLRNYKWKETSELCVGKDVIPMLSDVWEEEQTYEAGWLSGMFDGEGCIYNGPNRNGGCAITITQKEGPELNKIKVLLSSLDIPYTMYSGEYGTGEKIIRTLGIRGSVFDRLKFLGRVRPERLINGIDFNRTGRLETRKGMDKVVSITPLGVMEVAVMATSTRTFVCDGYPMHNCQDVALLEEVYDIMLPWITHHPNLALYLDEDRPVCTNCGSKKVWKNKDKFPLNSQAYTLYQCQDCGTWIRSRYTTTPKEQRKNILTQVK